MCEISASSWVYYKEIRYDAARSRHDARSHERKKTPLVLTNHKDMY